MMVIKNSLADAYRAATDEKAADETMRALVKASNALGTTLRRDDTSSEVRAQLLDMLDRLQAVTAEACELWTGCSQTAEAIAAAAVNAAEAPAIESDGTCYDGSWEEHGVDAVWHDEPTAYDLEVTT